MKRLTNPTLTFEVPSPMIDGAISKQKVVFKQGTQIIFEKVPTQKGNIFTVELLKEDTEKLSPGVVKMELSFMAGSKYRISDIVTANVEDVLRTDWN